MQIHRFLTRQRFTRPSLPTPHGTKPLLRLHLLRGLWLVVALLMAVHIMAGLPLISLKRQILGLTTMGPERNALLAYVFVLSILTFLVYFVVAVLIFWHATREYMALYTAFMLVTFGGTVIFRDDLLTSQFPLWHELIIILAFLGQFFFLLFYYLFPNGRFVPRWTIFPAGVLFVFLLIFYVFHDSAPAQILNSLLLIFLIFFLICCVIAQVYRYSSVLNAIQRQQNKWVIFGLTVTACIYLSFQLFGAAFPIYTTSTLFLIIENTLIAFCLMSIPISIGIAIFQYRLWEIDLLINRAMVYGALTASVIGLYVLLVGTLAALFQASNNLFASLIATGCVAVLVQPLRTRLQRSVNRLMYGERDDPHTMLARLGQRLEATLSSEAMLSTIVESVAQALKLPYAAIYVGHTDTLEQVATYGTYREEDTARCLRLPLILQAEQVGTMLLAPRSPDETFTSADQRLLRELAHQTALAVHAAQLTSDLQRLTVALQHSRERLVLTREEERRRIRRDLHDGLAPTLAALALTASMVSELISINPTAATQLANELQDGIRSSISDIRRLVYDLRPPTLDQLGLVAAIREHIAQATRSTGQDTTQASLQVTITVPETLPALSAAVEVAAYRIVQEALTNVIRHAHARHCHIQLALSDALEITISDDGQGIPPTHHTGVGLLSMRERAEELGGTCTIEPAVEQGTCITARLPLSQP